VHLFGHNGLAMNVESRDSVSLKPAELDEFGQLLGSNGLPISDEELDRQVESFPLIVVAALDGELQGFMLGSLERIGGTPAILWGLGAARKGKNAPAAYKAMTGELTRRAAISFPDEDVLVAVRLAQPSCYVLLQSYANLVPRPGYTPNGEDRAWGRRLAKRYSVEGHFDDRAFKVAVKGRKPPCLAVLDTSPIKASGGAKIASLVGQLDATRGQAMIAFGWAVAEELAAGSYVAAR
jgi:hypothetical protein